VKGACQAGKIDGNFFGADMAAGAGVSLVFGGASMHQGIDVKGNWFRNNVGGIADIDVTKLSNGIVGPNFHVNSARFVYTGTHNDADGNILLPPQNGFAGTFGEAAYLYGDNRFPYKFNANLWTLGSFQSQSPRTGTNATDTITSADTSFIANRAGTITLTLESAAAVPGRILVIRTIQSQLVVSASSNVIPLVGGAAGTAILAATAGKWALLHSDGSNWQIMAGN